MYPINDYFEVRSHLYLLIKNRSQPLLSKIGLTASRFPKIFLLNEIIVMLENMKTTVKKDIKKENKFPDPYLDKL